MNWSVFSSYPLIQKQELSSKCLKTNHFRTYITIAIAQVVDLNLYSNAKKDVISTAIITSQEDANDINSNNPLILFHFTFYIQHAGGLPAKEINEENELNKS